MSGNKEQQPLRDLRLNEHSPATKKIRQWAQQPSKKHHDLPDHQQSRFEDAEADATPIAHSPDHHMVRRVSPESKIPKNSVSRSRNISPRNDRNDPNEYGTLPSKSGLRPSPYFEQRHEESPVPAPPSPSNDGEMQASVASASATDDEDEDTEVVKIELIYCQHCQKSYAPATYKKFCLTLDDNGVPKCVSMHNKKRRVYNSAKVRQLASIYTSLSLRLMLS